MNRMWSVRTVPYLVVTVEPSTIGRRSRCTPSRETSGPRVPSRPAILSSSSRKMIPEFSTRWIAWLTASSTSTSFWASSWARSRRASFTLTRRRRVRPGMRFDSMSFRLMPTSSMPWPVNTSSIGPDSGLGVELDDAVVELAGAQLTAELLARAVPAGVGRDLLERLADEGLARAAGQEQIEEPVLRERLGAVLHAGGHLGLDHGHGELGEVPDHRLDVAADVADLGVLRGLDLEERRLGQLGEPPRDLRLPDPGGADHDDVLRRDLVAQLGRQVLPAPPVSQGHRHGALGALLADDVAVELGDDLDGRQGHGVRAARSQRTSTVMRSLV